MQKGENAGDQHFLLSYNVLKGLSFSGSLKVEMCGKRLKAFAEDMTRKLSYFQNYNVLEKETKNIH